MFLFDLHSHFSFKPGNSTNLRTGTFPDPNHWQERFKKKSEFSELIAILDKTVVKSSQLHGDAATIGGFRVICNGLYPLETGFLAGMLLQELATLTGYDKEVLQQAKDRLVCSHDLLLREYQNLVKNQNKPFSSAGNKYKLVSSFDDIIRTLKSDDTTLCILNSIEGLHAFAKDFFASNGAYINMHVQERRFVRSNAIRKGDTVFEKYIESMLGNIDSMKRDWSHVPFFITFSHHYYNHIAGHSPSLNGVVNFFANQDGATADEYFQGPGNDLIKYYFLGIRSWGYRFIRQLLYRKDLLGNPARRVLIDVKHMSPQARLDYYKEVKGAKVKFNDHIPIIKSHTAVSGRNSIQKTIDNNHKLFTNEKKHSKYFYNGVINLFDDEIETIIQSDGIIGLMIDERRIMGKMIPPEAGMRMTTFKKLSKKSKKLIHEWYCLKHELAWGEISKQDFNSKVSDVLSELEPIRLRLKKAYLSVFFRQIFHILDVAGKSAWDHLSLGTDYDGVINPIDIYVNSSEMSNIESDMISFWNECKKHGRESVKALYRKHCYNRSSAHWIRKLLWLNGMNFLKKYYTDDYLVRGIQPQTGWVLTSVEEQLFD